MGSPSAAERAFFPNNGIRAPGSSKPESTSSATSAAAAASALLGLGNGGMGSGTVVSETGGTAAFCRCACLWREAADST